MAEENKPKKRTQDELDKLLKEARTDYKKTVEAFSDSYKDAVAILKFIEGIDQWTTEEQQARKDAKRPALVVNELPKFRNKVCGEMRKNKVQINVLPTGDGASQENATIRAGLIKDIEYTSHAEAIYDHAGKMLTSAGFCAARVNSRYCEGDDPFLEELFIENIPNPLAVHPDPDAKDALLFSDGEFLFIDGESIPNDTFKKLYGEDALPGQKLDRPEGAEYEHWYDKDSVIIREYFKKEYSVKTMCKLSDGRNLEKDEAESAIAKIKAAYATVKSAFDQRKTAAESAGLPYLEQPPDDSSVPTILKERDVEIPKIKWYKLTAADVLEEAEIPGKLIPVAFGTGEYVNIAGKFYYNGMFKHAKDPQRMTNNAYSSMWETVALMPKSPFMATAKMIQGYDQDYLAANQENFPVLKYRRDDDFPGMKPERLPPAQAPAAMITMYESCKQDIKDTLGVYDANIGDKGPEVSRVAIVARQVPGETVTYIYPDNQSAFIAYIGKILNDKIPYYYDTQRDVRLQKPDGKGTFAMINTSAGEAQAAIKENPERYVGMERKGLNAAARKGPATPYHDITKGRYDVTITTGPAFATQRQEAVENMVKVLQFAGSTNPAFLYHVVANSDWPGAKEFAETIKKMVPPGVLPMQEGEQSAPPLPPTPQQKLMMGKMQLDVEKTKVAKLQQVKELLKAQKEANESQAGVKEIVNQSLQEVLAPVHPADNVDLSGMG